MVLILDCWKVHKCEELRDWMKEQHPFIKTIYVSAGCTSKGQPADVIMQRPLKTVARYELDLWTSREIEKQIQNGVPVNEICVETSIGVLRERMVEWLKVSRDSLCGRQELIVKGWKKCGLLRAWDVGFQRKAVRVQTEEQSLFKANDPAPRGLEPEECEKDPAEEEELEDFRNVTGAKAAAIAADKAMAACLQEDLPIAQ
jgi:hypothetical protein